MSGHRKLTPNQVHYIRYCRIEREIRAAELANIPTQALLARLYGVSQATILHASQFDNYKDID